MELDAWIADLHWRIAAADEDCARVEQGAPRVGVAQPLHAETARCEMQVADRVAGLYGGDHAKPGEPRNVLGRQVLGMLDPPTRIRHGTFIHGDVRESLLVQVEGQAVGAIADGVGPDLDAVAQGTLQDRPEFRGGVRQQASIAGIIVIRLEQRRAARAERAVEVDLDRANGEPVVEFTNERSPIKQKVCAFAGPAHRHVVAYRHAIFTVQLAQRLDFLPAVQDGMQRGPALPRRDLTAHGECRLQVRPAVTGDVPAHQWLCPVDEHPRGLAVGVFQDLAAERRLRAASDASDGQRFRVRESCVAVGAREIDGPVGNDGVEVLARGEHRRVVMGFDPAAARDPLGIRVRLRPCLQPGLELVQASRVRKIQCQLALADAAQVVVRVGKTRERGGIAGLRRMRQVRHCGEQGEC
jgi:hypothetical protein